MIETTGAARLRLLRVLLRIGGTVLVLAFPTMLLPADWMAATHEWLGLGEFPRAPVVDYLARSAAALYGFHGILLFVISSDPARYRSILWYLVFMNFTLGLMLVAVDVHAGMPLWWTVSEGPFLILMAGLLGALNR